MPRNPSGTYSLPEAAFVPGTVISSTAVNSDFSDIANALTDSLSRSGDGGMQAQLQIDPTGFVYTSDPDTGMLRTGANEQSIKCGGSNILTASSSGINVAGSISQNGSLLFPIGLGPLPWSGTSAPSGWILAGRLYSRSTYAGLWTFAQAEIGIGNMFYDNGDGSTTFGVGRNIPGRSLICNDSISGTPAGTLTQAIFGSNPSVIGNTGGAQSVTLTEQQMPVHSHNYDDDGHAHGYNNPSTPGTTVASAPPTGGGNFATSTNTIDITILDAGGGESHPNVQPGMIANFIVYAGV